MVAIQENAEVLEVVDLIDPSRVLVEALKSFTTTAQIEALEAELLGCENNVEIPVFHSFCKGVYARTITLPKGTIAIGHEHSDECLNIFVKGRVSVVIDGEIQELTAPATFVSAPHTRKIGFIHEDATWVTVHATNEREIDKLEAELIIKSDSFKKFEESTALSAAIVDEFFQDRMDYLKFVEECRLTAEQVKDIVENSSDRVDVACDNVAIGTSRIQGNGVIASYDFDSGKVIGPASINGKRTAIGRYTNHVKNPNAEMVVDSNGNINLVAVWPINKGQEITVNYRQSLEAARSALKILNTLKI